MKLQSKLYFSEVTDLLIQPQSSYSDAKVHSHTLDQLFGFNCDLIETAIAQRVTGPNQQFWYGLDLQSLQTPYSEILEILNLIQPTNEETWVDLGAGYGRMGLVMGLIFPQMIFKGFEFVPERVFEGNRILQKWGCSQAHIAQADIANPSFYIPDADLFFIYDFGSKSDVHTVLEKLAEKAKRRNIRVVARGRGVRQWILNQHPWLSSINTPSHYQHWSFFYS